MGQRVSSFWFPDPWWYTLFSSSRLSVRRKRARVCDLPDGSGKRIVETGGRTSLVYAVLASVFALVFVWLTPLLRNGYRPYFAPISACVLGLLALVHIAIIYSRKRVITHHHDGTLTIDYRLFFGTVGHWDVVPLRGKLWVTRSGQRYTVSYKGGGDEADLWFLFIGLCGGTDRERAIEDAKAIMYELGVPTDIIGGDN